MAMRDAYGRAGRTGMYAPPAMRAPPEAPDPLPRKMTQNRNHVPNYAQRADLKRLPWPIRISSSRRRTAVGSLNPKPRHRDLKLVNLATNRSTFSRSLKRARLNNTLRELSVTCVLQAYWLRRSTLGLALKLFAHPITYYDRPIDRTWRFPRPYSPKVRIC